MSTVVVWLQRDLRVDEHPAFAAAAAAGDVLVPLFVVDPELVRTLPSDGALFDFQAACLAALDAELRRRGGRLIVRSGAPVEVVPAVAREAGAAAVVFQRDTEPYAHARDAAVERALRAQGTRVLALPPELLVPPDAVAPQSGGFYRVFGAYRRAWEAQPKPTPAVSPARFSTPPLPSEPWPTAARLGRPRAPLRWAVEPDEAAARRQWAAFLGEPLAAYADRRDRLDLDDATSRLSPHLRFGTIAIARLWADVHEALRDPARRRGAARFADELAWRDFYHHLLHHVPTLAERSLRPEFDTFPWENRDDLFAAWAEGRTGEPLVDAALRQLVTTGWLPNRARLVAASYLVKQLLIDWRWGERFFRRYLLDGDLAANAGNWQWVAGSGVDPRPQRVFSPSRQAARFDPTGAYRRTWAPEPAAPLVDAAARAEEFRARYRRWRAGLRR